ncbi:hypothetical protein Poli38472_004704 [Pythium oligandrum]|uniref:Ankyrin repeat-containing domain n=1 Tax=Pythium oligandrum TaxID=41045 RepID=A0A8K1CAQ7_PYTOL|nr:hypothetical protein Poli38472_004704 [Pythium oligandrum]|eukprot:TMW59635.1 hypothetical protein Poli38472_004704 [Pythium oligandrum]
MNSVWTLSSAQVVCRYSPGLESLDHVADTLSNYLDVSLRWDLDQAVSRGYSHLVDRILQLRYANDTSKVSSDTMKQALIRAAAMGRVDIAKKLVEWAQLSQDFEPAMEAAASNGHVDVLDWLHRRATSAIKLPLGMMDDSATSGHLEVVKWLHTNTKDKCTTRAMDWAARYGHLHVVQWLHENQTAGCTTQAMDWAASNGHLNVVQWLCTHRDEGCTSLVLGLARDKGHLHVLRWLEAAAATENSPVDAWKRK